MNPQRSLWSSAGLFPRIPNTVSLCLLASVLLAGCASPKAKFQSVKDPAYHAKLERVLLPADADVPSSLGRGFMGKLLLQLETVLASKGVATQVVRVDDWDLDQNARVDAAATQFRATHYLNVWLARWHVSLRQPRWYPMEVIEPGPDTSVVFAFRIVDLPTAKAVWRSEASFYVIPRPEDVADQLVEQLAAAGFL